MPLILYKNKVGKSNEMNDYQKFIHKQSYQEIFVQKEISRLTPEVESRTQGSRPRPRTQKKSEAKAKDSLSEDTHSRGQGQECSRPRTKDQGHKRKCSPKKKVFTKIFQAISTKKRFPKNFSSAPQNFNYSKNSAVLEPRTGQFSRT